MKKYFWSAVVINCLFEVGVNFVGLVSSTGRLYQLICGMTFAVNPLAGCWQALNGLEACMMCCLRIQLLLGLVLRVYALQAFCENDLRKFFAYREHLCCRYMCSWGSLALL